MSKTEKRNGANVQQAVEVVAGSKTGVWWGHFTVGEVARAAGCSKPTAAKYIEMMKEAGMVRELERDMRYCTKQTTRSFVCMGAEK